MTDSLADFNAFRSRMNDLILSQNNLTISRFFNLDHRAYEPGVLGTKTKEMLGLVSSLVLRCDDCVTYHVIRCHEEGVTREEFLEVFAGRWQDWRSWTPADPQPSGAGHSRSPAPSDRRVSTMPAMMRTAPIACSGRGRSPSSTAAAMTAMSGVRHM